MQGLGRDNSSSLQMFIDKILARFLFLWVEGVYLSDFWNKGRFKINGVVIWSMGSKNIVRFLGKYILEV